MARQINSQRTLKRGLCAAAGMSSTIFMVATGLAMADPPVSMAPPIDNGDTVLISNSINNGADSVFQYTEIPQNQRVPINSGSFDKGGYQLYDKSGETIIVPFSNENLYVMKFGPSSDGTMYFVNDGGIPTLYLPRNGYLLNATVSGARWYPFGKDFHPEHPVFLGIAPSWSEYIGMGWYPHMICYGGYWSRTSFISGGIFLPILSLEIVIGDEPHYGWRPYRDWCDMHPAPFRPEFYDRDYYRNDERPFAERREFVGSGQPAWVGRHDDSQPFYAHHTFSGGGMGSSEHFFRGGDPGFTHLNNHIDMRPSQATGSSERVFHGGDPGFTHLNNHIDTRPSQATGSSERLFHGGDPAAFTHLNNRTDVRPPDAPNSNQRYFTQSDTNHHIFPGGQQDHFSPSHDRGNTVNIGPTRNVFTSVHEFPRNDNASRNHVDRGSNDNHDRSGGGTGGNRWGGDSHGH